MCVVCVYVRMHAVVYVCVMDVCMYMCACVCVRMYVVCVCVYEEVRFHYVD